ncbi:MAG: hypothetical protein ABI461_18240, partial [Polyangiaceae bacterium]
ATTNLSVRDQSDAFAIGFRLGFQIPLFEPVSLYPRGTMSLMARDFDETSGGRENANGVAGLSVGLYAPIDVEIAPHFFAGFGPSINHDLSNDDNYKRENLETTIGIGAELGVWL